MTSLLEKAFAEASKLPDAEQDSIARWLLDELAAEQRWEQAFDSSADLLEQLADEALSDFRAGRTTPLDLDTL